MKNIKHASLLLSSALFCFFTPLFAQDSIVVNKQEVGNFFERNWIWISLGVLFLLILLFSSGRSRKSRTTTVIKDDLGNVKRVETTELRD